MKYIGVSEEDQQGLFDIVIAKGKPDENGCGQCNIFSTHDFS